MPPVAPGHHRAGTNTFPYSRENGEDWHLDPWPLHLNKSIQWIINFDIFIITRGGNLYKKYKT